jgi:hypothetical protein
MLAPLTESEGGATSRLFDLRALPAVLFNLSMRVPFREGHKAVVLSLEIDRREVEKKIKVPSVQSYRTVDFIARVWKRSCLQNSHRSWHCDVCSSGNPSAFAELSVLSLLRSRRL